MGALFRLLRVLGDLRAASKGRLPQRLVRRKILRGVSRRLPR